MDHPLAGCWAKLDRAKEHLDTLERERQRWSAEGDPYTLLHEYDRARGRYVIRARLVREMPGRRWGIIAGDVAHSLRSTLGHLVWRLVERAGADPRQKRNQFPIFENRSDFVERVARPATTGRGHLAGLALDSPEWALIEKCQPYHRVHGPWEHPLALIAWLNNEDKHRVVPAAAAFTVPLAMMVGVASQGTRGRSVLAGKPRLARRPVEDGAELVVMDFLVPAPAEPEVYMSHRVVVHPAFGHRPELGRGILHRELGDVLFYVSDLVGRVKPLFE